MINNAKKIVPILISVMIIVFSTYLILKGIKKIVKVDFLTAFSISTAFGIASYFFIKSKITKTALKLENSRVSVNTLFTIPLIFSAALLSFAHGANDVANAIGPLAAINDAVIGGEISAKAEIPFWVMAVGAFGLVVGLALYGPKLIRTVGSEITELDQMRAFSIAMAAAITVIIASQLGLPVSSTHIAIGGVFGVGFLREYLDGSESKFLEYTREKFKTNKKLYESSQKELSSLESLQNKTKKDYEKIVDLYKRMESLHELLKDEKEDFKNAKKIQYVKRDAVKKIVAAWIITVPTAAMISAGIFFMIRGIIV